MEVCPLSRGVMLLGAQPLSAPLQSGIRFLHPPLPAAPSARLATRFPSREGYGLTTFRNFALMVRDPSIRRWLVVCGRDF